ncbi:hypothetical protein BGZ83_011609 [Gryganskiella cystojenkinii]|nr:hypothetical protein BGZ83_011609 [Gryganskiella cystojenkinii]
MILVVSEPSPVQNTPESTASAGLNNMKRTNTVFVTMTEFRYISIPVNIPATVLEHGRSPQATQAATAIPAANHAVNSVQELKPLPPLIINPASSPNLVTLVSVTAPAPVANHISIPAPALAVGQAPVASRAPEVISAPDPAEILAPKPKQAATAVTSNETPTRSPAQFPASAPNVNRAPEQSVAILASAPIPASEPVIMVPEATIIPVLRLS